MTKPAPQLLQTAGKPQKDLTVVTVYCTMINPLSPNINLQILQTDLHTFPLRIS